MKNLPLKIPYLWLVAFFLVPFAFVVKLSFSEIATAIPPYQPTFSWGDNWLEKAQIFTLNNYALVLGDKLYLNAFLTSLRISLVSSLFLLLTGYAIAFAINKTPTRSRAFWLTLIIIPFWTSFLIRVYAWIGILKADGYLDQLLALFGLPSMPLLHTETAIIIGIVYSYLPFMILPIYANLVAQDAKLLEAAHDLGANAWQAFLRVTLPLSKSGIFAGIVICFIPILGEMIIPDMLGGRDNLLFAKIIWIEFFNNRDWALASALSMFMLLFIALLFCFWWLLKGRAA